jgi:hypothetical protein
MKMFGFSLALNKALVVGAIDAVREVAVNHTSLLDYLKGK